MITCEEKDLRGLLRLMRDACLLTGSHEDKRRQLVAGLGSLIGADFVEWIEDSSKGRVPHAEVEMRVRCLPVGELVFSRRSAKPFSERELSLARWMALEFPWAPAQVADFTGGLSRREKLILDFLLQSYGRKEIAKRLGISTNTVQGYIKNIYRHFDVHSHAELLRHYFQTRGEKRAFPGMRPSLHVRTARAV